MFIEPYGACIALGFVVAILFIINNKKHQTRSGFSHVNQILDCIFFVTIAGILGGRVVFFLEQKSISFCEFFCLWDGGFSVLGSVGFSVLACILFARIHRLSLIKSIDFLAIYTLLVHATGRIGCYCAGCCGGCIESVFGCFPVQVASSLYYFLAFIVLYRLRFILPHGSAIACYLMIVGFERYFFDQFRYDRCIFYKTWSLYEVCGMAFCALACIVFCYH